MFIGHFAVGMAGRAAPKAQQPWPSLGAWFLAAQWMDVVWPVLLLTGAERVRIVPGPNPFLHLDFVHYPWTHSLAASLVWAVLFGAVYRWWTGNGRAALWLGGAVFSHWVLDWVVHVPDLPLYPGSDVRLGLGLWHSPLATLIVEGAMFALALGFYTRTTRAADRVGRWGFWALMALLVVGYAASLLGPPPPDVHTLAISALVMWLLFPWAHWVDRHRVRVV